MLANTHASCSKQSAQAKSKGSARCKGPLDHLQTAHEGGKMPLPYNRQTDKRPHNNIQFKESASLVLALGGGTVMTAECAEIVHSDTICIYLRASVETLMEHLSGKTDNRPLLSQKHSLNEISTRHCEESEGRRGNLELETRIKELMTLRSDTYEKTAHIVIDTDGKSIEAVASEIISKLG